MADDDEVLWKWNKFVDIGNKIHKMKGQVRLIQAKYALNIAEELVESKYMNKAPIKDQQLYETLLSKIASYLDGNAEIIKDSVEKYFLIQHCKAGLDENLFSVSFSHKRSGIQTGFICDISDGGKKTRYFIKTHQYQYGPTEENPKSLQPPDTK